MPIIVVHYHELWLKGRNRKFFLGKLVLALRRALGDFPVKRFAQPGDRVLIHLAEGADIEQIVARLGRVSGIGYFAMARPVERTAAGFRCSVPSSLGRSGAALLVELCGARQAQR